MQQWLLTLIENFIVGGLVVSSVSYIGTYMDPILAAIWWAFPTSLLPSMLYMYRQNKPFPYIGKFAFTSTYALVVLFFTLMSLGKFFNEETHSFWIPVAKSAGVWLVLSIIYYFLIKYFNLEKYF